jgi:hypothetical protein
MIITLVLHSSLIALLQTYTCQSLPLRGLKLTSCHLVEAIAELREFQKLNYSIFRAKTIAFFLSCLHSEGAFFLGTSRE